MDSRAMLLDMHLGNGVNLLFATPMLARRVPGAEHLNAGLKRILAARERSHPEYSAKNRKDAISHSNVGGWRTDEDVLRWPEPEIAELKRHMMEGAAALVQLAGGMREARAVRFEYNAYGWININRDGAYNIPHSHPENHWSGVYYVETGAPDPARPLNGLIEFQDPRPAAAALPIPGFDFGHKFTVAPQPGLLLVFPSWHLHWVHPFFGGGERISIAFNVKITKLEIDPASSPGGGASPAR